MTSLVFCFNKSEAVVVTDTLAIDLNYEPNRFTTKAHYLPHLRAIIAGTGVGGFADDWFALVNKRFIVRGVETLNRLSPELLAELWESWRQDYQLPDDMTTTVFHFGFSEISGEIVAVQFHSAHGFKPEQIESGLHIKPPCTPPPEVDNKDLGIFDLVGPIMEAQRAQEAEKPVEKRCYIGGQAMAIQLTEGGCDLPPFSGPLAT